MRKHKFPVPDIPSVFIYPLFPLDKKQNATNDRQEEKFESNTKELLDFAINAEPFACKNVEFLKTEVTDLQDKLKNAKNNITTIKNSNEDLQNKLNKRYTEIQNCFDDSKTCKANVTTLEKKLKKLNEEQERTPGNPQ